MYRFKKSLIALIGTLSLVGIGTVSIPRIGRGASGSGASAPTSQTQNVNVVNTPTVNAQQNGGWTVGINTAANTVKIDPATLLAVRDADSAARQPFQALRNMNIPDGSNVGVADFDIPTGKRAVIEYVSVTTLIYPGQHPIVTVSTVSSGGPSQIYIPSLFQINQSSYDWWVASQQVRLYADAGANAIEIQAGRDAFGGLGVAYTSISGYLVDVP